MAHRTLSVVVLALLTACAAPQDHVQSFPPDARVRTAGEVAVELREVHYEAERLTVEVEVRNLGKRPLRVGAAGILLAQAKGGLEFPRNDDPQTALQPSLQLAPGEARPLRVAFDVAGLEPESHLLRLRQLWAGDEPQPAISLPIPGIRLPAVGVNTTATPNG